MVALALTAYAPEVQAQGFLKGLADKAKEKVKEKVNNTVGNKVDETANSVLNGNKANKNNDAKASDKDENPTVNTSTDFVRGGKILFQDDFKGEKVGEFPSKWDLNSGKAEVKKFNGETVVEITNDGFITPLVKQQGAYLTDEFTVEFDFYYWQTKEGIGLNDIKLVLSGGTDRSSDCIVTGSDDYAAYVAVIPVCDGSTIGYSYYNGNKTIDGTTTYNLKKGWHTVALSFNKRALKMYIDGNRVVNLPKVRQATWMGIQVPFDYDNLTFIRNVVIAQGAVELYDRNAQDISAVEKAMAETGKFVTNNINFETGKATILPESMDEIKKVADYMLKNKNVRFEVQGHCDNQGSDKVNDPLSQSRAEAVVAALVKLGVDEWNLRAVGRGSHEPIADNKTKEGQAKNRRVEFIRK